ncbi:MAG: hypothetical protein MUC33_09910 [Desulfobacterales bacterium]|jgi:hypothetical protein|nr:hypothetical protein [Desulfobacterales bacterium]
MTGKAQGYCLLNIPEDAAEAETGFAGWTGEPVALDQNSSKTAGFSLRSRLWEMQMALNEMKSRLAELEAGGGK